MVSKMKYIILFLIIAGQQWAFGNGICARFYNLENGRNFSETRNRSQVYRKKLRDILSEKNIFEGANILQEAWQANNTYQTRYKLMLDENFKPITDFEAFVKDHKVPEKYREFYRPNSDGNYEEDLKGVPNRFLSHGSLSKNLIGSRSILRQVAELLVAAPGSVDKAYELVIDALQVTHQDWMNMNPWAKGVRPEHIRDLVPDLGLTNASGPYSLFQKYMDFSDPFHLRILEAFHRHQFNLQKKRVAGFGNDTIEAVYLDIVLKKGVKVPIDSYLEHFLDSKMKTVKIKDTISINAKSSDVAPKYLEALGSNIRSALGIDGAFQLKAPDTPPGSGARAYLVIDSKGQVVGALKVQNKNHPKPMAGLDELLSALTVEKFIRENRPGVDIARTLDYGLLSDSSYFSIVEPAKSKDLDGWLKSLDNPLRESQILETSAKALVDLHRPPGIPMASNDTFDIFKGNSLYEVRKLREYVNADGLQKSTIELGVSESLVSQVRDNVKQAVERYEGDLDRQLVNFGPATVHGDFHGGNIFYNERARKATMIDYGTLSWTIAFDKRTGTGDPANDLGRIMGHFLVEDLKKNQLSNETFDRARDFYRDYILSAGIEIGSKKETVLRDSVLFYLNRYFAIQAGDLHGDKFSSKVLSQSDLMKNLYQLWLQLDRVIEISSSRNGRTRGI